MRTTILLASLIAFSGIAFAEDKPTDLTGTYTYTTTSTMKIKTPVAKTLSDTSKGQLTVAGSAKSDLVFTWSATGTVCHLHAKRVGNNAVKFTKGETCTEEDAASKSEVTMTLESGSGTVIDNDLTLNLSWKFSGTLGGTHVSGDATESTTCEKE